MQKRGREYIFMHDKHRPKCNAASRHFLDQNKCTGTFGLGRANITLTADETKVTARGVDSKINHAPWNSEKGGKRKGTPNVASKKDRILLRKKVLQCFMLYKIQTLNYLRSRLISVKTTPWSRSEDLSSRYPSPQFQSTPPTSRPLWMVPSTPRVSSDSPADAAPRCTSSTTEREEPRTLHVSFELESDLSTGWMPRLVQD